MSNRRTAQPKIVYRPRLKRVVILLRGKKLLSCPSYDDAAAFMQGWHEETLRRQAAIASGIDPLDALLRAVP